MAVSPHKTLVIYLPSLPSGGVERLYLNLAPHFIDAGVSVTFLLDQAEGTLLSAVPDGASVVELGSQRFRDTFPSLISYLRRAQPDLLLTAFVHKSIISNWAIRLAGAKTHHIASVHNPIRPPIKVDRSLASLLTPFLSHIFLEWADSIVAVSQGLADDAALYCSREKISIILNGSITTDFDFLIKEQFEHPWLCEDRHFPTFIAVGRLSPQKDFSTLLRAFADFVKNDEAKLIIFGEGDSRANLEALAEDLQISKHVDLPGFIGNVFPALRRASTFILSSAFEGWPLVVPEALACGTPVVSTDCTYGPREILDEGRYGILVPVGDWRALSAAMRQSIDSHPSRIALQNRGKSFSVHGCAKEYLALFERLSQ